MFARSYGQTPGIIQGQMDRGPQGSFGAPANDLGGFGMPAPMEQPQTFPAPPQPMIGHLQSIAGQMQAKPAMQPMQPGAPILTNGPGIY